VYCARCNEPVQGGDHDTFNNPGATGAGTTVYMCKTLCLRSPQQTAPYGPRYRRVRRPRW
jgi:hypothetical protein